MDRAFG